MTPANNTVKELEEISLEDIGLKIWARRWLVAAFGLVAGASAAAIALVTPEKYQATVLLSPVVDQAGGSKLGGAGALLSQLGGLGSLAGLGGASSSQRSESVATLQSRLLTEAFIAEKQLLPVLFHKQWNAANKEWKTNEPETTPTLWKGEELFRLKVRSVTDDKKTGLISLSILWTDPTLAAEWANEIVLRTNTYLRDKSIAESQRNLAYLNEQLKATSVVELQNAIYGLIEAEIKKEMIARGSKEFAFQVVDPATPPERRISPKRGAMTATGLFIGLVIGIGLALVLPRKNG